MTPNAIFSLVTTREERDHDRRVAELREIHDDGDCPDNCEICEMQRSIGEESLGG